MRRRRARGGLEVEGGGVVLEVHVYRFPMFDAADVYSSSCLYFPIISKLINIYPPAFANYVGCPDDA